VIAYYLPSSSEENTFQAAVSEFVAALVRVCSWQIAGLKATAVVNILCAREPLPVQAAAASSEVIVASLATCDWIERRPSDVLGPGSRPAAAQPAEQ